MDTIITFVTVGHVDHGKSSVIGRLLSDAGVLPKGKLETVKRNCELNSRPFEYAFLLDALKCEQAQGITLDIARCFFSYENRRYEILDAPGHLELLKNMVTGASRADAALMVIDASCGIEENTRQHFYYLKMLGINQISIIINKMDLVNYSEERYIYLKNETKKFLAPLGITPSDYIPVSSINGDNIVNRSEITKWYCGLTVLERISVFTTSKSLDALPLRMPVQDVYKFTENMDDRRIVSGSLVSGTLKKGDEIIFYPSGKKTSVKNPIFFGRTTKDYYSAGEAAGFTMKDEIIVNRGEIACKANETPPIVSVKIKANIFWLGKEKLKLNKSYIIKLCTTRAEGKLEEIIEVLDASTLLTSKKDFIDRNEVATVIFTLTQPIAFDIGPDKEDTGRFVIVDDYEIAGGGTIIESLSDENFDIKNLKRSSNSINAIDRAKVFGKGAVLWFTGLSGSGKTTIATEVEHILTKCNIHSYIIDGDEIRTGLNADLGFSDEDRRANIQRTAHVAKMFKNAGLITIVTLISPFAESRKEARNIIGEDFYEIYINTPLDVCRLRDPKKLYEKTDSGKIKNFTGKDSPYEPPQNPDLEIDTTIKNEIESVNDVLKLINDKIRPITISR